MPNPQPASEPSDPHRTAADRKVHRREPETRRLLRHLKQPRCELQVHSPDDVGHLDRQENLYEEVLYRA